MSNNTIDAQERLATTVASIHTALASVNAACQRSLRPAFKHDGETYAAETSTGRAEMALDNLRSALCDILIDSDDDPAATMRYMNWLITQRFAATWSHDLSVAWLRTAMIEGRKVGVNELAAAIATHNGEEGKGKEYQSTALYWWRKAQIARTLIIGSLKKNHVIVADSRQP